MKKFFAVFLMLFATSAFALSGDIGDAGANGSNHHNTTNNTYGGKGGKGVGVGIGVGISKAKASSKAKAEANARAKSSSKSGVYGSGNSKSKSGVYGSGNSHQGQGQYQGQSYTDNSKTVYEAEKESANVASSYTASGDQTGVSLSGRSGGLGFTWTARYAKTMQRSKYLRKAYGPMVAMAHDCNYAQFRRDIRDAHRAGYLEVDCSIFDKNPTMDKPIR